MVIRNRLLSLFFRIIAFIVGVYSLVLCFRLGMPGIMISYFSIQAEILATITFGFMIVFNAIDLRHGIHGVPAGAYMPASMAIMVYLLTSSILFNAVLLPAGDGTFDLAMILSHIVFPLFYLFDWILFEEKGTIKFHHAFYWVVYPFFYTAFILLRPYIFDGVTFLNGTAYPFFFLNPVSLGWGKTILWIVLIGVGIICLSLLMIFLNNLLAGRYRRRKQEEGL